MGTMNMQRYINKKYKLIESENFDAYLKSLKVRLFYRKMANIVKPTVRLTEKEGKYIFQTTWTLTDTSMTFKPGLPFEETRVDGEIVKSVVEFQDNKMIHTQKFGDRETVFIREFTDKQIKTTLISGDIISTRIYERVHDK